MRLDALPNDVALRALTCDVKKLSANIARAQGVWDGAHKSNVAMRDFVAFLRIYKNMVTESFPNRPQHAETPQIVTEGFVYGFRVHILIMAGCRYNPSEEALNSIVDSLLAPITWGSLYNIIPAVIDNLLRLMAGTQTIEGIASSSLLNWKRKFAEARCQNLSIRSTCQRFRFLGQP